MFVITGGGSGIGRALAKMLAERGEDVLIIGRHENSLREVAASHKQIAILVADVSTQKGRDNICNCLSKSQITLKGLVHNAGVIEPIEPMHKASQQLWQQCLATNLEAPFFLTQDLFESIKNARILHIGSGAAYFPVSGWSVYCVSKAALSMLVRCWQQEYPGLAIANVMPGIADTNMQATIRSQHNMEPEKLDFFKSLHQNKQLLSTETVALFLSWLLLDISTSRFSEREWDIYDTSHHSEWLVEPHKVPSIE